MKQNNPPNPRKVIIEDALLLILERIQKLEDLMAITRTELNTKLDTIPPMFTALTAAIQALKDAIAGGGDFQVESDKVDAIIAGIQSAITQAS